MLKQCILVPVMTRKWQSCLSVPLCWSCLLLVGFTEFTWSARDVQLILIFRSWSGLMASSTEGKTEEIASTDQPAEDFSTWFKETYPKSKATFIVFYRGYWWPYCKVCLVGEALGKTAWSYRWWLESTSTHAWLQLADACECLCRDSNTVQCVHWS